MFSVAQLKNISARIRVCARGKGERCPDTDSGSDPTTKK